MASGRRKNNAIKYGWNTNGEIALAGGAEGSVSWQEHIAVWIAAKGDRERQENESTISRTGSGVFVVPADFCYRVVFGGNLVGLADFVPGVGIYAFCDIRDMLFLPTRKLFFPRAG